MLTDDELDRIAEQEVLPTRLDIQAKEPGHDIVAERMFLVAFPTGAFYRQRGIPEHLVAMVGTAGFFVDRATGTVRHINPAEYGYAGIMHAYDAGRLWDGAAHPAMIQWILTHPTDHIRFPLPLPEEVKRLYASQPNWLLDARGL